MSKSEIIEKLKGGEVPFSDYGFVYVKDNGDLVHWGEVCGIEHNGKWLKANLYKLPKIFSECCLYSSYYDEWYSPEELHLASKRIQSEIKQEFGSN